MAQYQDGAIADGPNGPIVFRNGQWAPFGAPQAQQPRSIPLPRTPRQQEQDSRDREANDRANSGETRQTVNTQFDNARAIRDDFAKSAPVSNYMTIIRQYANGLKAEKTAAGDQALINSYAQMLNPSSTVMLGEYEATSQVDSTVNQIKTRLQKEFGWNGGGRISENARRMLLNEMQNITTTANQSYNQQRQFYGDLAKRNGFDPVDIVGPHFGEPFYQEIDKALRAEPGPHVMGDKLIAGTDAKPDQPQSFADSYLSQGMSGVNEGIANTLGAPVDLVTAGLNLIPRGINAAANTQLPTIDAPVGGSQWLRDKVLAPTIGAASSDPRKQMTRRMGQSVGAAAVPLMGTSGSLRQFGGGMLAAAGGGAGGAVAQQTFPGNPVADFAGEVLGSGLTGAGLANVARRNTQRQIEARIPTVPQLKEQAGELYRQAEARGVTADPMMTQQLAENLRTILRQDGRVSPTGRISEVYPKAREAMQLADDYAGSPMNPTQMQTVRKVMADGMTSPDANERRIASQLTGSFDEWSSPMAPELAQARDISSRYLNAQGLERARELANARASQFSGSGMENALRTEYRALDRNAIKGNGRYSDALTGGIEAVSRGTPASNLARGVGRLAPTGPVSFGMGSLAPAAVGTAIGGPAVGMAVGTAFGGAGAAGRAIAGRMTERNADLAELIARNGGAIPQAPLIDPETQKALNAVLAGIAANVTAKSSARKKQPGQK